MKILNSRRSVCDLLKEIGAEEGIEVRGFSSDWILALRSGGQSHYVFGYDFPLNNATAQLLAKDKAGTAEILGFHGVPRVEHRIFHGPQMEGYVPSGGNWRALLGFFDAHGGDVVCKRNEGTGGSGIFRARSVPELEAAVHRLFEKSRSIALSPFLEIAGEHRVVMLDGEPQVVYTKHRPCVRGDGASTLLQLVSRFVEGEDAQARWEMVRESLGPEELHRVLAPGEPYHLRWQHNLGLGAEVERVEPGSALFRELGELARGAMRAIDARLASVDVVDVGGERLVLEINAGIMMESYVKRVPGGREHAKAVYRRIVRAMFAPAGAEGA
jgi:glutathione synthase/RimK-type ligase-like ATP-grasp enzyme